MNITRIHVKPPRHLKSHQSEISVPVPCDTCPHVDRCRLAHMSCSAYGLFMRRKKWRPEHRIPSAVLYRQQFVTPVKLATQS